ncbi:HSF1 protein, partial [Podargus strigoides]|nr:HSF1 protein [Podargus strigoides]
QSGNSFHVFDQGQFAKEVLPKYFKHNNMASFVRQLNMCKYSSLFCLPQGALTSPRVPMARRHLVPPAIHTVSRRVRRVSSIKNEDIKVRQDNVTKLLTDIQVMKGKQESMDSKLIAMK